MRVYIVEEMCDDCDNNIDMKGIFSTEQRAIDAILFLCRIDMGEVEQMNTDWLPDDIDPDYYEIVSYNLDLLDNEDKEEEDVD